MKAAMGVLVFLASAALAQLATAGSFTYRGELAEKGQPARGMYDFRLTLYADREGRLRLAGPLEVYGISVVEGRFAVGVDFPDLPPALERGFLEVAVRAPGAAEWLLLSGKEEVVLKNQPCPESWALAGNASTNPLVNFLGTTDHQPLVLRTRNARSLRIEPSAIEDGGLPITVNWIAGSHANQVTAGVRGGTIGGGGMPTGNVDPEVVNDGPNRVTDHYSTVGGGYANQAGDGTGPENSAAAATVGGGVANLAAGFLGTIAGGASNVVREWASTVGGGIANYATGRYGVTAGGQQNTAAGFSSMVMGGALNCAGGHYSFAAGRRAKVRTPSGLPVSEAGTGCLDVAHSDDGNGDEGTFVWADDQDGDFVSTGPRQFLVRAQGGVAINTNAPTSGAALTVAGTVSVPSSAISFGSLARQMINLFGSVYGIGVQTDTAYFRSNQSFAWFQGGSHSNIQFDPGAGGGLLMTLTPGSSASLPSGVARAQMFVNVSDGAEKKGFMDVDVRGILERLMTLPIRSWEYRSRPGIRHLGPTGQDFRAAFGIGEDGRTISTVDAAGVALAAIQGLYRKLEEERDALKAENAALRAELEALRKDLASMQEAVGEMRSALGIGVAAAGGR